MNGDKLGKTGINENAGGEAESYLTPALIAEMESHKNMPLQSILSKSGNGTKSNPDLNRNKFGHGMSDAEQAIRKSPVIYEQESTENWHNPNKPETKKLWHNPDAYKNNE